MVAAALLVIGALGAEIVEHHIAPEIIGLIPGQSGGGNVETNSIGGAAIFGPPGAAGGVPFPA
ncbi:hypothetical protein D3C72_2103780 [compost metagenome]